MSCFECSTGCLRWFMPRSGRDPLQNLKQLIIPAIVLGYYNMALVARVTRSSMLDVMREDYIRTAYSKGLREKAVIVRHA